MFKDRMRNRPRRITLVVIVCLLVALLAPSVYAAGLLDQHQVYFQRISNARDLGGYRTTNGRVVKKNILIRTGELSFATKSDLKKLKKRYHLKKVFDFRHPKDAKYCPDKRIAGVSYTNLSIKYGSKKASVPKNRYRTMKKYGNVKFRWKSVKAAGRAGRSYTRTIVMSSYSQKQYRKYFNYLLSNKNGNGVLIHCVHGKDRTGVAAFMTLVALGVPEKTAYREYQLTNDWMKTHCPKTYRRYNVGVSVSDLKYAVGKAKKKYGSLDRFLEKAYGLDKKDRKKLQQIYTR